jgi:cytoplasmic iron level regulating protein YaaA (DUF328/UPF0246 family)
MLFLLSPAKTLDFETPLGDVPATDPLFVKDAVKLIALLRKHKVADVAALMDLSEPLARLNVARYKAWRRNPDPASTRQAALAFDGDVYGGLQARTLPADDLAWAQAHLCLLSGLYGVLRPLDRMQPYRLEMGTRLDNPYGTNLYQFWGRRIAQHLNQLQKGEALQVVVNLASQEYFKVVDTKTLKARVIECVFEEQRENGEFKIISFMAKRARGLMARYAITHRIETPNQLEAFAAEGYAFQPALSLPERLVYRRHAIT